VEEDVLVDYFVNYARTVVKSAGNVDDTCDFEVTSGVGFNTITVGNYDDMGSCDWVDDAISPGSCWGDPYSPHGDRQKPEVAAPGTNITTLDENVTETDTCVLLESSGTSFSAPHVAGAAALLIARDLAYKEWPELAKATLMATAFNNVEGGRRLSEKDGAGGIDAAAADAPRAGVGGGRATSPKPTSRAGGRRSLSSRSSR
jgi:subtilisin family serine protease